MDYTNNPGSQSATLTTGTDDEVGTIGAYGPFGVADSIIVSLLVDSDGPLTDFKAQCRLSEAFGWSDYLTGADWVSLINPLQRGWTSAVSVATSEDGETATAQFDTLGYPLWRFTASGTLGAVITFEARAVFSNKQ